MTDPIAGFCLAYHDYHDISVGRRRMQERVLREFETFVAPRTIDELEANDLQDYLTNCRAGGLAPSTVGQRLHAIRPFVTWAWRQKLITAETLTECREVKAPRGSKTYVPRPYKRKEIRQFWTDLDAKWPWANDALPGRERERGEYFVARWRRGQSKWSRAQGYAKRLQFEAIVALALYGGLRRDEIHGQAIEDMHPDNDYVAVRGAAKNRDAQPRDRAVPWTAPEMRDAIAAWLEFREALDPGHDFAWLSLHQHHYLKPMRHRQFEMLLHDIGRGYEFHRMRHTCATELLRNGMPLESVRGILGHSRLQQTLAYVELLEGDIVRAAEKVEANFSRALRPPLKEAA